MTSNSKKLRTTLKLSVAGLAGPAIVIVWFQYFAWRQAEVGEGIYLTRGGRSLVVLERGWFPKLRVVEGYFPSRTIETGQIERGAAIDGDQLVLTQIHTVVQTTPKREKSRIYHRVELSPSSKVPGDWDLSGGEYIVHDSSAFSRPGTPGAGSPPTGFLGQVGWRIKEWAKELARRYKPEFLEPEIQLAIPEDFSPVSSYLHRIDDPRIVDYFKQRAQGFFTPDDLKEFRRVFADYPSDPYLMVHAIDVEAQYGDLNRAEELLSKWQSEYEANADDLLLEAAGIAEKSIASAKGLPWGEDLGEILKVYWDPAANLETRIASLGELVKYDRLAGEKRPLVEQGLGVPKPLGPLPNYLDLQINARVMRTIAALLLIEGRQRESLDLLAALYQQGNMMSSDGILIQRLIGIAICFIAKAGLDLSVLNACESVEDLDYALELFDRIARSATRENEILFFMDEMQGPIVFMSNVEGKAGINFLEAWIRYQVAQMHFSVSRTALAAKRRFKEHGSYPATSEEYLPYLPEGIPEDWFGKDSESLKFTDPISDPYAVYSLGPDELDSGGRIQYSPTNGTKSVGDLIVEVSEIRKYPFPDGGIQGLSVEEVLDLFPEGLPTDAFRGAGSEPLSILDATPDGPVTVFGFGPSGVAGGAVIDVEMLEIPGMIPKPGHDRNTPVNTSTMRPGIQYVFHSGREVDYPALEAERQKRWEALTDEERDAIEFQRNPRLEGYSTSMYVPLPSPEEEKQRKETREEAVKLANRRVEVIQRLQQEGKLDAALYPSPESPGPLQLIPYDPTNGVKSDGQIFIPNR